MALGFVILTSIGAGLLTTFKPSSGHPEWIAYHVIFGAGMGLDYQTTLTVVQTLSFRDLSIGTSVVLFLMILVGTVMLSVVENVFTNQLVGNLGRLSGGVDPDAVMGAGATGFREMVSEDVYGDVLVAYNDALTQAFHVAVGLVCIGAAGGCMVAVGEYEDEGEEGADR